MHVCIIPVFVCNGNGTILGITRGCGCEEAQEVVRVVLLLLKGQQDLKVRHESSSRVDTESDSRSEDCPTTKRGL